MLKALKHIISLSFLPSQWLSHAMFCVLLVAQLVYVKFPATPPYEELEVCLENNTNRQARLNGTLVIEILAGHSDRTLHVKDGETIENLTKTMYDYNVKSYLLRSWLKSCSDSIKDGGLKNSLHDQIIKRLKRYCTYLVSLVDVGAKEAINRQLLINQFIYQDSVLQSIDKKVYCHLGEKEIRTVLYALQLVITLDDKMILSQMYWERFIRYCGGRLWFRATSVPKCIYAFPGQKVVAQIALSLYEPFYMPAPDIYMLNEGIIDTIDEGVAFWQAKAKDLGVHIVHGYACMNLDTMTINQPWSFQYLVLERGISLQGDKMNTLYTGVPNPVTISVPGYPLSALSLRVPGASVTKLSDWHYTISVQQKNKDVLYGYIDARNTKGTVSTVHGMELHVKELPPPVATIAGVAEGDVLPLVQMLQAHSIGIAQRDTEMEMEYNLRSYQIGFITRNRTYYTGSYTIHGNDWNTIPELKEILQQLQPGDRVIISDIEATDSRGVVIDVPPVSYTIR